MLRRPWVHSLASALQALTASEGGKYEAVVTQGDQPG